MPEQTLARLSNTSSPSSARALVIVLVVAGLVSLASWPSQRLPGDPVTARAAAIHALQEGSFSIPMARKAELGSLVRERGSNFFEHEQRGSLESKYRRTTSALFLPPLVLRAVFEEAPLPLLAADRTLVAYLNAYHTLLTLALAAYLLLLARLFTQRASAAVLVVLATLFATALFHYLRAQSSELLQVLLFNAFVFHGLSATNTRPRAVAHLVTAVALLILLTQQKPYFALAFAPLLLLAWRHPPPPWDRRVAALMVCAGGVLAAGWVLLENALVFGSFLDFGYRQWEVGGRPMNRLSFDTAPEAFWDFAVGSQSSLFAYFPLLLLALPSLRGHSLPRGARLLVWGSLLGYTGFFSLFSDWTGGWAYGPRYLVFAATPACLCAAPLVERLLGPPRAATVLPLAGLALLLGGSLFLQVQNNDAGFFAREQVQARFFPPRAMPAEVIPALRGFFSQHESVAALELVRFRDKGAPLSPLEAMKESGRFDEAWLAGLERDIRGFLVTLRGHYFATSRSQPGQGADPG